MQSKGEISDNRFLSPSIPVSNPSTTTGMQATAGSTEGGYEMIPSLADFSVKKKDPKLPCKIIPISKDDNFSGREDVISNIKDALIVPRGNSLESSSNPHDRAYLRVFAICGP